MVNTAFALKFPTPCKLASKCDIYHLCYWFPLVCTFCTIFAPITVKAWYTGKALPWLAELICNLTSHNSRFWPLWVTVFMLTFSGTPWSCSLSVMLEVIIELAAATIRSKCSPIFSSHSKWNDFEQYKAPPVIFCRCIVHWQIGHYRGTLLRTAFDILNLVFCRNMQQRVVILWTATVFLSTTGLFWAVPLQMSVRQISVAKRLKPCKSSPLTYALRQERQTLWDSMGFLCRPYSVHLDGGCSITSLLTGSYGFLCSLIASVFLCPDLCW